MRSFAFVLMFVLVYAFSGCSSNKKTKSPADCRADACTIGGVCYDSGTANPANACQVCSTTASKTAWSNVSQGSVCSGGVCDGAGQCTAPVDGDATPADGDETPVDGDETQMDGDEAPVDGDETPVDGDEAPVDGDEAPVDGDEAPVDGDETPVDGDETPVDGDETPVDGDTTSEDGDAEGETESEAEAKTCPSPLVCTDASGAGNYACLTSSGNIPSGAPICDSHEACQTDFSCWATSAGTTNGVCLQDCTL